MTSGQFDQTRAEDFGGRMMGILNDGCLALLVSLGHRTGLFDSMAGLPPSTSAEIARAADLQERYVREWLGGMVVGRIVEHADDRYSLPPEHAAFLTRDAAPNNVAAFTQYVPLLGTVENRIVEAFRKGGGVPYSGFPRFQEVMAEGSGQSVVPAILDHILPLVPGLPQRLESGIDVLDVGCGSGRALNIMARAYPKSQFTGYDISREGVSAGEAEAGAMGLTNARFAVRDVTSLEETERYDLITTFDAVHDQAWPDKVLRGIARALKPDGIYLMQDIGASSHLDKNLDHPAGPFLYTVSTMHCMTVSLAEGGMGLGAVWGEEKAKEMLAEAGFTSVEVKKLAHDFQNSYFIIGKG